MDFQKVLDIVDKVTSARAAAVEQHEGYSETWSEVATFRGILIRELRQARADEIASGQEEAEAVDKFNLEMENMRLKREVAELEETVDRLDTRRYDRETDELKATLKETIDAIKYGV